jgi:PKD repeat protein
MTSFTPTLESETLYYWKIMAHDEYSGRSTSPLWNFTTKKTDSSGGGSSGGGGGIIEDLPPDANASLSDTNGFVHSQIQFDGSLSTDDGYITAWEWDFDDGHYGSGEKTTHIYTAKGEYQVTLTVTDDAGSQSQDLLTISIITANTPPESPYIEGIENGTVNQEYHFIISSSDIDNDTVHIEIEWGDTTNETIQLNSSEQQISITHSWTLPGPYTIQVRAFDSYTWSSTTEKTVLIDTLYFPDVGYLVDTDNDSVYDVLRFDESGVEYSLKKLSSTEYVYDSDNDDAYDFVLDIASMSILDYSPEIEDNTQLIIAVMAIIIIVIILIFISIKYKK